MIQAYVNYDRSYNMPLCLVCDNCKKEFITRKRSTRVIRFCSQKCSNELLNPIRSNHWANFREERKKESREELVEKMRLPFEQSFEKSDGCWIWKGSRKGPKRLEYGSFHFRDESTVAHRFSWLIYKGDIPTGILVLHKCDVPLCVNPDHLFLGTHLDNERDKIAKGRHKGEKLNPDKVKELKSLMASDFGDMNLARKYGVSYQTIWHIRIGRTWKDITI